jgi:hypothetical protein
MWMQYADEHRGICVEMATPEIFNEALPVRYVDVLRFRDYFYY